VTINSIIIPIGPFKNIFSRAFFVDQSNASEKTPNFAAAAAAAVRIRFYYYKVL